MSTMTETFAYLPVIEPTERFEAIRVEREAEIEGDIEVAGAVRMARLCESFPKGYTTTAYGHAVWMLATCASGDYDDVAYRAGKINELYEQGRWYKK